MSNPVRGLLLSTVVLLWGSSASAQVSYDPYADSVAGTAAAVTDADNATGAPNGTNASMVGVGASLTLDMGTGEEGLQNLRVHLGQINLQVNLTTDFLDANKAVIKTETRQLGADPNPSTEDFNYNWKDFIKAYRFVRVSSPAGGGVNIDAVEALGYLGATATQDTDGDGRSDRSEQENGTNPLVADPSTSPSPSPTPTPGGTTPPSTTPGQVNPPPAADNDKDKDGMADDWELDNGLDPSDPSDATGDPDGDYLTNLGEYKNNTDPNKADDLRQVFCGDALKQWGMWHWLLLILLLVGLLAYLVKKRKHSKTPETKTT